MSVVRKQRVSKFLHFLKLSQFFTLFAGGSVITHVLLLTAWLSVDVARSGHSATSLLLHTIYFTSLK
jgi:hypothetical protein